jgi:D-aminopeptidase
VTVTAVADGFNDVFNPLFEATVEASHEAVLNSLFAAETTTGRDGVTIPGLPVDQVTQVLRERRVIA